MGVSKLKKALLCGALVLATTVLPARAQNQTQNPYKQSLPAKRDPFVPAIKYLPPSEAQSIVELENLRTRLVSSGFDKDEIMKYYLDDKFRIEKSIIDYLKPSTKKISARKKLSYNDYRKLLALDDKIKQAPAFMHKYLEDLCSAESLYGVDKRYIVAIKGVESDYGKNFGKYYAFNALASMYLTGRKEFAYSELKEYLAYCAKNQKKVYDFTSSWAGAIGCAQFMPSSLNRLFIGKKGDFNADPLSMIDAIYSSAYYLKKNGWDSTKNNTIPTPGSSNWNALWAYNHDSRYVQALIELANKSEWDELDLKCEKVNSNFQDENSWIKTFWNESWSKILKGEFNPMIQNTPVLAILEPR